MQAKMKQFMVDFDFEIWIFQMQRIKISSMKEPTIFIWLPIKQILECFLSWDEIQKFDQFHNLKLERREKHKKAKYFRQSLNTI